MKEFRVIAPPGWQAISLGGDIQRQATVYANRLLPTAEPALRGSVASRLATQFADLAAHGAVTYLAAAEGALLLGSPSLIVGPLRLPPQTTGMEYMLAVASQDSTAELFDMEEAVALRTYEDRDATADVVKEVTSMGAGGSVATAEVRTRAARYIVGVPEEPEKWAEIMGFISWSSVVADATSFEPHALLDDVVSTLRWSA